MKVLDIKYIRGHIIEIDKTNLSITEPYKIIAKNKTNTFITYFYKNNNFIINKIIN